MGGIIRNPGIPASALLNAGANIQINGGASGLVSGNPTIAATGGGGGYSLISTFTFTGAEATKVFSSIPNTYKDLFLVFNGRSDRAGQNNSALGIRFNGDTTAANYHTQNINASGATVNASAAGGTVGYMGSLAIPAATSTAGFVGQFQARIIRYANTLFHKQCIIDLFNATTGTTNTEIRSGARWLNTAAVNSVEVFDTTSSNLTAGSTLDLYGIV